MKAVSKRPGPSARGDVLFLGAMAVALFALGLVMLAYRFGGGAEPTWNAPALVLELALGRRSWPSAATWILIIEAVVVTALIVAVVLFAAKRSMRNGPRRDVDKAADTMTPVRKVDLVNAKWSTGQSQRLAPGLSPTHPAYRGILMGHTVKGNLPVHMPWEWVAVVIAGARMGKTAAIAVPAACSAPGPLVATSNKPDIYTHTRYTREQLGGIWLFDLQGVTTGARGSAEFFWNPLRQIHDLPSAKKVASYFVGASKEDGARVDAYFDGSAQDLLATYMLAAALAGGDLIHAVEWMANDQSTVPAKILEANGEKAVARMLSSKQNVTERQRDGFFDMARRFLESLDSQRYAQAILPNRRVNIAVDGQGRVVVTAGEHIHDLPEFKPEEFVVGTDSLYALSKEGPDSAAALTTAIIGQVLDCAEEAGSRTGTGRLEVPLVAVLDEAANCCRLQDLPNKYSHFGSRGIIPIIILQSPSQGRNVWGPGKFQAMLDACNMVWYGGNVTDKEYLGSLSELIGEHHVPTESSSRSGGLSGGGGSVSTSWQTERILKPDDLAALPGDRAVIQLAASKPLLLRKAFWGNGPYAAEIERSKELYEGGTPAPPAPVTSTNATPVVPEVPEVPIVPPAPAPAPAPAAAAEPEPVVAELELLLQDNTLFDTSDEHEETRR